MKKNNTDTEQESLYSNLDKMSTQELLLNINKEDMKVAAIIEKQIPNIEKLVDSIVSKMKLGGRLFYIGAGTSGRIGILDASECPPTFGVPDNWIIGIIAGGDSAIRKAVENAEDDVHQAWRDLSAYAISGLDVVIGIAASGNTPYVIGGLNKARENNIITGSISCNSESLISKEADYPIELIVGPEFLTGSTRMKAGTSQKLVLNMISTSVMIKLGRIYGNKMIDMQLSNNKLVQRGIEMIVEELQIDENSASKLLEKHKSVRAVLLNQNKNLDI
ncbi:N-acetylmuramic acid 6-phosphate etherase [Flavobacterium sp. GSP27]|uniref:N-acetylmuramic acid 6-phosphate etherase n=1 Tax=unclassified Flavobacterium TaxID=196869 RepID=UPI000F823D75|nr:MULTISPECIES: N-acetylmuramic acid 6-phosphate etherase [unclassified Flavobacterium]RTY84761.1 N-acetylmuramic acid 6-phosphate etherase [Flavobacterium sp. ZB4P23]RTY94036.1 N-acetylmuramic acid 6-phosphate etherase [Flavobacterium sp. GSN2]RTZ05897.1 N-acetylmuramic acid 6-phosphate etherase [Flavobacterium sp. GSP27]